ncbi:hypothetical protein RYX36_021033 [Vicia faba]
MVNFTELLFHVYVYILLQLEHLPVLVTGIWTDDNNMQFEATTQFRKLLSIERSPPIEEVIQAGVVPRFVEFLMREDFPQLQFEAAWALTNIASGTSDNTKVVIDSGAIPIFVKLLDSPSDDVREQAVWALGNVAGDSPKVSRLGHISQEPSPLIAFRNFEQETRPPGVWEPEQGAASTAESPRDNLASLYRPPFHLMFNGSFDKIVTIG